MVDLIFRISNWIDRQPAWVHAVLISGLLAAYAVLVYFASGIADVLGR